MIDVLKQMGTLNSKEPLKNDVYVYIYMYIYIYDLVCHLLYNP